MRRPSIRDGRTVQGQACEEGTPIGTFEQRQKEMRPWERQRDKAAKRKEIKARKAAGITIESDRDAAAPENVAPSGPTPDPSTID